MSLTEEKKYLRSFGFETGSFVELIFPKGYYRIESIEVVPKVKDTTESKYIDPRHRRADVKENKGVETHLIHYTRILSKDGFAHNTKIKQKLSEGSPRPIEKAQLQHLITKHTEALIRINEMLLELP